ncbi:MAG: xylulokinase [Planctomycetes bacterium]|nr:xylulokinase [Planctomycetota bacterium]
METVLGIDLGTSSVKALLVGADGQLFGEARAAVASVHAHPGWSEQSPETWWRALAGAVGRLASEHAGALGACRAVGVSGQMHGSVLLDAAGRVLRPAILWNDSRSAPECEAVMRELGLARLLELAGNRAFPGFTAPKIRWLRRHEPAVLGRTAHLLLPKDFLVWRLTGGLATDVSDASGTLLLDIGRRCWSAELCSVFGADPAWLPPVRESSDVVGAVRAGLDLEGLPAGIPVVAGAGDQAAAAVGVGVVRPGETSVCLGSSGVVFVQTDAYRPDPAGVLHAFCHAAPAAWHLMGVMLSAGSALEWFATTFPPPTSRRGADPQSPVQHVTRLAADAEPGARGVLFLPYLAGERCPHPDPTARATFHGMTLGTDYADLARAVVEGIVVGLAECADRVRAAGADLRRVRVTGGATRSPLLMGLLASALGCPVETAAIDEGSAYGAALLAGLAAGWAPAVDSMAARWQRPGEPFHPRDRESAALEQVKARRLALYRGIRG